MPLTNGWATRRRSCSTYDCEDVAEMMPIEFIRAARVPEAVQPQDFGQWQIRRRDFNTMSGAGIEIIKLLCGFDTQTVLHKFTMATLHHEVGEVVMDDGIAELSRHLPIWMAARGRVLVTGLGLGCVVRGLLASDRVDHVTVIEKDCHIVERIGPEFWNDPRVSLYLEDALMWEPPTGAKFDFAWHDLFTDPGNGEPHLQRLHAALFLRYRRAARVQGAWAFPRDLWRAYASRLRLIGGPNFKGRKM